MSCPNLSPRNLPVYENRLREIGYTQLENITLKNNQTGRRDIEADLWVTSNSSRPQAILEFSTRPFFGNPQRQFAIVTSPDQAYSEETGIINSELELFNLKSGDCVFGNNPPIVRTGEYLAPSRLPFETIGP